MEWRELAVREVRKMAVCASTQEWYREECTHSIAGAGRSRGDQTYGRLQENKMCRSEAVEGWMCHAGSMIHSAKMNEDDSF